MEYILIYSYRQTVPGTDATGVFNSTLSRDVALPVNATVDQLDDIPISEVQSFKEPALPWYSDQALPFEITVAAANEYGAAASAKLFGVEILNEGWGMSIDDSVNEMQATFVARIGRQHVGVTCSVFGRTTRCHLWAEALLPSRPKSPLLTTATPAHVVSLPTSRHRDHLVWRGVRRRRWISRPPEWDRCRGPFRWMSDKN